MRTRSIESLQNKKKMFKILFILFLSLLISLFIISFLSVRIEKHPMLKKIEGFNFVPLQILGTFITSYFFLSLSKIKREIKSRKK